MPSNTPILAGHLSKADEKEIDDRSTREVSAEVYHAIWNILDDCYDMDGDTAGRIAQTASDLTEVALTRKCQRELYKNANA